MVGREADKVVTGFTPGSKGSRQANAVKRTLYPQLLTLAMSNNSTGPESRWRCLCTVDLDSDDVKWFKVISITQCSYASVTRIISY